MGKKVTVIDLDPQCHLSVSLGITDRTKTGVDEVMLHQRPLVDQLISVRKNLNCLVAGPRLQEIEQLVGGTAQRGDLLGTVLQSSLHDQDFIFIDCPPSSGVLVANALFSANELLVPMTSDYLALQGLSHLLGTIKKYEQVLKKNYRISLVISRYVASRRLSKDVIDTLLKYFPDKILATPIRETALLAECPSFGKTIFEYRPGSRSARDFAALAQDFLEGRVM